MSLLSIHDVNQNRRYGIPATKPSICTQCLPHTIAYHLYLQSNLLALDTSNDDVGRILWNDFIVVQHLEFCFTSRQHIKFSLGCEQSTNLLTRPCPYG